MKKIGILFSLCLGLAMIAAIDLWLKNQWQKNNAIELSSLANIYQNRLETTIQSRFNAIESVSALFAIHPDTTPQEFAHFAHILLQNNPPIRALQWADKETRVTYVFPPKDNEITISNPMHLLADPKRGPYVKKAITSRRATAQGPFELRQGGMGIVVRSPIFRENRFLGLAIGVYDVPVLIKEACERLSKDLLVIQLSDASGTVFNGPEKINSNWEKRKIIVADTTWSLTTGWLETVTFPFWKRLQLWLFGMGFWILLIVIFYIISEQNKRLTQTVAHRTRELKERNQTLSREIGEQKRLRRKVEEQKMALRQAQKMESLGTLAGGVAHEYNNILSIILGNAELALEDIPSWNPAQTCLQEIKSAALRGKEVGRQILLFINKVPVNKSPLNICNEIKNALKLVRIKIPDAIEIHSNFRCDHEMIMANPSDIHQLLMNLCTNAAHAVTQTDGIIEVIIASIRLDDDSVSLYEGLNPGDYVKLTVADNGSGMAPHTMDRIFEPYFTTKEVDEGLGMGLAVVYGIVKNLGGAIRVESQPGSGTSVEVLFPLLKPSSLGRSPTQKTTQTGSESILLVEDERALLKMSTLILEHLGYQVTACSDGLSALETFKKNPDQFDLILTDISMPNLPGDFLAREIINIRPDIPIVLITGHSCRMDETKAKQMGIAGYATKPLMKSELSQIIRQVLDARN